MKKIFFVMAMLVFSSVKATDWQPDESFINTIIAKNEAKYISKEHKGKIKGFIATIQVKEEENWAGTLETIKTINGVPKTFPTHNSFMAVMDFAYADYNPKTQECAIVVVKENYPILYKKFIQPIQNNLTQFQITEQDIMESIIVHEFAHCIDNIETSNTKLTQLFNGSEFLMGDNVNKSLFSSYHYSVWKESFADVFQSNFLFEKIHDLDIVINTMNSIRLHNKHDKKHHTFEALNKMKTITKENNFLCDVAHQSRLNTKTDYHFNSCL